MRDRHLYQQESALLSPPALHWAHCGYRHRLGRRSSPRAVVGASTTPDRRSRPDLQDPIQDQSSPRPAGLWLPVFNSQAGYLGANPGKSSSLSFTTSQGSGFWPPAGAWGGAPVPHSLTLRWKVPSSVRRTSHALPELHPPRDPDGSSYTCFFAQHETRSSWLPVG